LAVFSRRACATRHAGIPGEHNIEVFRELGVSDAELTRLTDAGVLVAHPRGRQVENEPAKAGQAA
jgi:hypothetical protein